MRAVVRWGAGAVLVLGAAMGCEITRPATPDPNAVSIRVLLEASEREARMMVRWGRDASPVPAIVASLEGPGWTAPFSDSLELGECFRPLEGLELPNRVCLGASLPEAIRPGVEYRLSGEAPLGAFTGEMEMPNAPVLEPPDTLRISTTVPSGFEYADIPVPVRYRVDETVGRIFVHVGTRYRYPQLLEGAERDTIIIEDVPTYEGPKESSIRLVGVGRNYTRFVEASDATDGEYLLFWPWPETGIEGEGVYGYFDGASSSPTAIVMIEFVEE